ncbi:hypothetical protein CHS0354_005511 [Potamilus streckersoni]|uniref:Uncharacterized protein n=1 Tax=Potamilus streckersoni TaxID=2493646 RepID=A0AAE0SUF1_9BIVA|nr:hypothetical protein CHS0354_005511 [Potamilus streckersoni]
MLVLWIFAGVLAGIEGQVCQNLTTYNACGQRLQSNISSVTNENALTFESLNYICGNGTDTVKCFLDGLQTCPNSSITFKSEFTQQQWNVQIIKEVLATGCQTQGAQAFMSNYGCIWLAIYSSNYDMCIRQAVAANPLGVNSLISCGLQKSGTNCITSQIGGSCKNQTALDFLLKWYYIKGNFEHDCSGVESLAMTSMFPLVGTIYIFLMLLL